MSDYTAEDVKQDLENLKQIQGMYKGVRIIQDMQKYHHNKLIIWLTERELAREEKK